MSAITRRRSAGSTDYRSGADEAPAPKGLVVLVALLALLVGVVAGGLVVRSQSSGAAPSTAAVPAVPVTAPIISAGPSRFEGFVPVGYQRTEAGAIAAAAAFTAMTTELIQRPEAEVRSAARAIATAEAANAVEATILQPITGVRSALALAAEQNPNGRALIRTIPLGTRLAFYSDARAQVDVWAMGITGLDVPAADQVAGATAPQAGFTVTSYVLVWERGDWHVADYRHAKGVGPTFSRSPAPTPGDLLNFASQYAPFRYRGNTEVTR